MPRAKKHRVLLVGAGRRVGLAKLFAERGCTLYAYEQQADEPVASVCKGVAAGLAFDDPECLGDIERHVQKWKITHVVPLMDPATVLCADLPGCIGSPAEAAMKCYDKRLFAQWMEEYHPESYPSPATFKYPKFVKPRYGRSSRGTRQINVPSPAEWSSKYVVQDCLVGDEVSVDVFVRGGECMGAVARTRERVEGGEVIVSRVLDDQSPAGVAAEVCSGLGIEGPANVQLKSGKVIEVNARFGGGCLLSIAAGFDMVGLALGVECDGPPWQIARGMVMRRYHTETYWP